MIEAGEMTMIVKLGKKQIKTDVVTKLRARIKSFRFQLQPITTGLCFPKKKSINTYFFCQNVDIVITDKDQTILYLYPNIRSEKRIFWKRKAYYFYIFPAFSTQVLQVGKKLPIITSKK